MFSAGATLIVVLPAMGCVTEVYPTKLNVSDSTLAGTLSENAPSALVLVLKVVPWASTLTPGKPCPFERSVTQPERVRSWAAASCPKQLSSKPRISEKVFIVMWKKSEKSKTAEAAEFGAKLSHS